MYLWGFLCFLFIFAATGDCLQCITCKTVSTDNCTSTSTVNCPEGQVCALQHTVSITGGIVYDKVKRFCAPQSECSVTGVFTNYSTVEKIATTCCSSDSCTPENPQVPTMSSEPNGVICPPTKCTLPGSCGADQNLNCTGNATMCLLISTSTQQIIGAQNTLTITRGCASSGYCNKNNVTSTTDYTYAVTTYKCSDGIRSDGLSNTTSTTTTNTTTTTVAVTTKSANNGTSHRNLSLAAVISLFILLILI